MSVQDEGVRRRLNDWKQRLIDTSKKNRLLHFQPSGTGTVHILEPPIPTLFKRLVKENKAFTFHQEVVVDLPFSFDDDDDDGSATAQGKPLKSNEMRTDLPDRQLPRTLYALRQKSRTSLQEQGVVTLFLAMGLLEWFERSASSTKIISPLLLVPVELQREVGSEAYKLALFEEEMILNPALAFRLASEGVVLPEVPKIDAIDLSDYFQQTLLAVQAKGWWVQEEAYLSLFSFLKFTMYQDLDKHASRALSHPLVRALAGDNQGISNPTDLPLAADLDRIVSVEETYQILDADSTQQEAIQAAKRGASFVLQGPPGTGKSQTIANIISECLAIGKKVLFVSEKMAALDVVHRRLTANGLGDFCLQAHSHKANKRDVVEELGRVWSATAQPRPASTVALHQLTSLKDTLSHYVAALHAPRGPLGYTAYQVHGLLAQLAAETDLPFEYGEATAITPERLAAITAALDEIVHLYEVVECFADHPWKGVLLQQANLQTQTEIRSRFSLLDRVLGELRSVASDLATRCLVEEPRTIPQIHRVAELAMLASTSPRPPMNWLRATTLAPLVEEARSAQPRYEELRRRKSAISEHFQSAIFRLATDELEERLTNRHQALLERIPPTAISPADALVRDRTSIQQGLSRLIQALEDARANGKALADECGLPVPDTLGGFIRVAEIAELVEKNPRPERSWLSRTSAIQLLAKATEAKRQFDDYQQGQNELMARYEVAFLDMEHQPLIERFATTYASPFRVLMPSYHRDLRSARVLMRTPGRIEPMALLQDLKLAKKTADARHWTAEKSGELARDFGRHYRGADTDWAVAITALQTVLAMLDKLPQGFFPEAMARVLINAGVSVDTVGRTRASLQSALAETTARANEMHKLLSLQPFPFTTKTLRDTPIPPLLDWLIGLSAGVADFLAAYDGLVRCSAAESEIQAVRPLVTWLREARDVARIEMAVQRDLERLQTTYGHLFSGVDTRWETVLSALEWTSSVLNWFGAAGPHEGFVGLVYDGPIALGSGLKALSTLNETREAEWQFLEATFDTDALTLDGMPLWSADVDDVRDWLKVRLERLPDLERWLAFSRVSREAAPLGLQPFLNSLVKSPPPPELLTQTFQKRFFTLWLDAVCQEEPLLANFSGRHHESLLTRFRSLDKQQLSIARDRLRTQLIAQRPKPNPFSAPNGEVAILQRETAKKIRHKPLRQLFGEIPNLLQALKPCFLMSPLSVAQFLDPEKIGFDVVVFDEASQICSEDAVGAIMRAQQVIVVGDDKQLPPSRFFSAGGSNVIDDEQDADDVVLDSYESILDECTTLGLPQRRLLWHYRSQCEALIAFSNHRYYRGGLVTFPSPYPPEKGDAGDCVSFVHVSNGVYVPSGKGRGKDTGTNRIEAQKVAELVVDHFKKFPTESLGVIAFSEAQQRAIDEEIYLLRHKDKTFEPFFAESNPDAFFIKNLENVQGDERDAIIFSVGYGKDASGAMAMRFGPLNAKGGERRLNVAVTRAKRRVCLVSSILPQDIDLSRVTGKGPADLRAYMEFARNGGGHAALGATDQAVAQDTEFEDRVYAVLTQSGLIVHRSVGVSQYRVDFAVEDEQRGKYLLGVLCDNTAYASSNTVRDRDRLRQEVLEGLGWNVVRLWSSDWVRHPESERLRLFDAIRDAQRQRSSARSNEGDDGVPLNGGPQAESDADAGSVGQRGEEADGITTEIVLHDQPSVTLPQQSSTPLPLGFVTEGGEPSGQGEFAEDLSGGSLHLLNEEELGPFTFAPGEDLYRDTSLRDGLPVYVPCQLPTLGVPEDFYLTADYKPEVLVPLLERVVSEEGPIHLHEATRRMVSAYGMGRAGAKLADIVTRTAQRAARQNLIEVRQEFLWPVALATAPIRVPARGDAPRPIDMIALEEIAAAAHLCVKSAFGMEQNHLVTTTARLLGFDRTGTRVNERIRQGINLLITKGDVEAKGTTIALVL